eukprot:gene10079-7049_t
MPELTADAADVIAAIRGLRLLDDAAIHSMTQLFFNRTDEDLVEALVAVRPEKVASALLQVAQQASTPHKLGYVLCFFADLVFLSKTLAHQVGRLKVQGETATTILMGFVTSHESEIYITNPAIFLAGVAMRYGGSPAELEPALITFFDVVIKSFTEEVLQVSNVEFVVRACAQLARRKDLRVYLLKNNVISHIPRLLTEMVSVNTSSILQLIYSTLLLTWLLSYEYEGTVQLQQNRMIPQLLRVLQRMQKEKCLRLALMILWNMIESEQRYLRYVMNPTQGDWVDEKIQLLSQLRQGEIATHKGPVLLSEMVGVGMQKTLGALKRRKFGDEDILALLEDISARLEESMETITSFSEYRGEVLAGAQLRGPQALGKLILETRDSRTLAVACHDLGETVRYHPTGRSLLLLPTMKGVKERVINLIEGGPAMHTKAVMVQQWEYIAS